jgi:uncharacterized membrane protein
MNTQLNGQAHESSRPTLGRCIHHDLVIQNLNDLHDTRLSLGDRMADRLADTAGSWRFLGLFFAFLALWALGNGWLLGQRAFDPYPFMLLNLLLSLLAGVQAPIIMMSQNRQEAKDRLRSENDYQVNLKAELRVAQLHQKLDLLREQQWTDLLSIQQQQIDLLERLSSERPRRREFESGSSERIILPRRRLTEGRCSGTIQDQAH